MHSMTTFSNRKYQFSLFLLLFLLTGLQTKAQSYKKMTPEVYSQWNKITQPKISDYANTITYMLEKEIGDKRLAVYVPAKDTTLFFDRVKKSFLDPSGKFIIYTHNLAFDSLQTLQRKKTDKDKLPKDSLTIINVFDGSNITFSDVEKIYFPEEIGDYVLFTKKHDAKPKDSLQVNIDSLGLPPDTLLTDGHQKKSQEKAKQKSKTKEEDLYIYHLYSNKIDTILRVNDFVMAEEAPELAYVQKMGDSLTHVNIHIYSIEGKASKMVLDDMQEITNLSMDKNGNRLSFLALSEKTKIAQPDYDLYLYVPRDTSARKICGGKDAIIPTGHVISKDKKITFSESGKRLYFGIAPILPVQDTLLLDSEIVQVEIWKYDTPRLFTEMNATMEEDRKQTFSVMYNLTDNTFFQLEKEELETTITSVKGDGRYALKRRVTPYQKATTWLGDPPADFILIDTKDNSEMIVLEREYGHPRFSPSGLHLYWWNRNDSIWKVLNTETKIISVIGLWSTSTFYDEENDVPQKADPYGLAGWLPGDSIAILYDRYDLWQMKPSDPFFSNKMTSGRANKDVYRYIQLNPKDDYIPADSDILLHVFNEKSKTDRYEVLAPGENQVPVTLFEGNYKLSKRFVKAAESASLLFTKENFEIFPDLLLTDTSFVDIKKISDANPQQKEYGWGRGELVRWQNYDGKTNEGMIFYPPQFDPDKQYPMIVNFYEKSSSDLYRHRAPEAHRSTINYSYYTNNGYIIFNPDIHYTTGQPGDDCFNAVESGVDYIVDQGFVDESRIALQGHSWGGYQVAYLLTQTNRYRCAESGAPVVNMVSAYGGIRWGTGMSRMFQYEKTQSRLGISLWEDPETYHKNSPIYNIPKVKTPVLILHNDMDGAVPWYQGIEYFMALRRLNKPAWMLNYNQEPHWPVKWQNRLDFNIRMEQFFNHYLKDAPMPLWMKEGNTPLEKGILNKY